MAIFGKKKSPAKKSASKSKAKSTPKNTKTAKNDAAAIAKKMKEKSASGECAFC